MPRVLALDTATQACTLALADGVGVSARHELLARAHNRHILAMLSQVLEGRSLADAVDVIACGVGPGSFTGLRVAVSVAQGLAWSQDLPVHAFCSVSAQVYSAADQDLLQEGDWVLSTIDAQVDQLYGVWGRWEAGQFRPTTEVFVVAPENLLVPEGAADPVIIGSGEHYLPRFPPAMPPSTRRYGALTPDASVMSRRFVDGNLPMSLQAAHALAPRYVQRDIGWKKLAEQGPRD